MKTRTLGDPQIQIAPIVFGGNVFGWTIDEKKSFEVLDAFVDAGFNCVDTADTYSAWVPGNQGGESEAIIGKWMKARNNRDQMIIATKVGMEVGGEKGLKAARIKSSAEGSLKRLQTDYIDLYFAHQDDPETSIEETLKAFDQLQAEGKVRTLGASNYSGQRLNEAILKAKELGIDGYKTLQPQYNLYDRSDYESDLESICVKEGISVVTYFSLASGFLTGKYRSGSDASKSQRGQGVSANYLNDRGLRILKALDEVSEELRSTPTQISLAWLLHRPSVTAPIVSATSVEQVMDIAKASQIALSAELLDKLNQASAL